MKNFFQTIQTTFKQNYYFILFLLTLFISLSAQIYFYLHGQQNLADYDAIARLNIARKIIDSITPGIGQLGGIWPPFPQLLILPFVSNNFLWHSGLAGSIVSGTAFVISALFLEKTTRLITNNKYVSFLVWLMFVTDINLLLLQTMAMSEPFFLLCLIMSLYLLVKWIKYHDFTDFLLIGVFTTLITLNRYEGFFVFFGVFVAVCVESILAYWKKDGKAKVEGMILVFLTVGAFGILLWCLYCWLFYKDPLFWLHLYSAEKGQIASVLDTAAKSIQTTKPHVLKQLSFLDAFTIYSSVILWTNGIITTILGLVGMLVLGAQMFRKKISKAKKQLYLPVLIISLTLFGFLIFGYQRGLIPAVEFPPITIEHLLSKTFNNYSHSNIRYGIILAPFIFLFAGFAASRNKIVSIFISILFAFQLFTIFFTPLFLYFSFPASWSYSVLPESIWFADHYDGGLVLVSANRHENFMFQTNLPYKDFIYEGTRNYWLTSLNNPQVYAKWVVYTDWDHGDAVNLYLTEHAHWILANQYVQLYEKNGVHILRHKDI